MISLYRKLKNDLPFPIACKELAKKYLNEDIEDDYKPSKEDEEKQKEKESLRDNTQLCARVLCAVHT